MGEYQFMKKVIAIDGPAGAGKSTVAQLVAAQLKYVYIDTGAMYRAVAWKILQETTAENVTNEFITASINDIDVRLSYIEEKTKVEVNGQDITDQLKIPAVNKLVSQVASIGQVREKLVDLQRKMAKDGAVVMDGRDIASNVLPNADLKIFLTASVEERAQRRFKEMKNKGYAVALNELKTDIAARDRADMQRKISPLVQTKDAVLLDTTAMNIDEVVQKILSMARD